LQFTLDVKRKFAGKLWLRLPQQPRNATCNENPTLLRRVDGEDIFEMEVSSNQRANILIDF
jgi:hypothetical protein